MPRSKSDVHGTPLRVYDIIEEKWGYKKADLFDPCPMNADFDGLCIPWKKINFVNPPYTLLREFVKKADDETRYNHRTVLLLPAKTDQDWFHDYIIPRSFNIHWIRRRLKFTGNKYSSTQPHFLVLF